MINKVDKAIEIRKAQARNKEISKKVKCVAKHMGQPLVSHGELSYAEWEERGLEVGEYDDDIFELGWHFYALAYGYNITFVYEPDLENVWVEIGNQKVFQEVEGDVVAYASHIEWETALDNLYKVATVKEVYRTKKMEDVEKKTMLKEVSEWLVNLKKTWNLEFSNIEVD